MISQLFCHTYSKIFTFLFSSLILPRSTTPMMSPAVRWAQTRPMGCCRRWHRPPGTLPCYYKGAGWLSLRRLLSLPSLRTFAATCTLLYSSHLFVLRVHSCMFHVSLFAVMQMRVRCSAIWTCRVLLQGPVVIVGRLSICSAKASAVIRCRVYSEPEQSANGI